MYVEIFAGRKFSPILPHASALIGEIFCPVLKIALEKYIYYGNLYRIGKKNFPQYKLGI